MKSKRKETVSYSSKITKTLIGAVVVSYLILKHLNNVDEPYNYDGFQILEERSTDFGRFTVVQKENSFRVLVNEKLFLGGISYDWGKKDWSKISALPAFHVQSASVFLRQKEMNNKRMLLIGLGTGGSAQFAQESGSIVDIVEISKDVVDLAKKHFFFSEGKGKVHIEDANTFITSINANDNYYDVIIHDIFTGTTSSKLLTVDVFDRLKRMLKQDGVLLVNFCGFTKGPNSIAAQIIWNTLHKVFANVRVFRDNTEDDTNTGDHVFFASDSSIEFDIPPYIKDGHHPMFSQYYIMQQFQNWEITFETRINQQGVKRALSINSILTTDNAPEMDKLQRSISDTIHEKIRVNLPEKLWSRILK